VNTCLIFHLSNQMPKISVISKTELEIMHEIMNLSSKLNIDKIFIAL